MANDIVESVHVIVGYTSPIDQGVNVEQRQRREHS